MTICLVTSCKLSAEINTLKILILINYCHKFVKQAKKKKETFKIAKNESSKTCTNQVPTPKANNKIVNQKI